MSDPNENDEYEEGRNPLFQLPPGVVIATATRYDPTQPAVEKDFTDVGKAFSYAISQVISGNMITMAIAEALPNDGSQFSGSDSAPAPSIDDDPLGQL